MQIPAPCPEAEVVDDLNAVDEETIVVTVYEQLERNGATLVFRDVPAEVCPNCGEDYVDEAVTRALMQSAEDMVASGAQVDIRTYAASV